MIQISCLFVVLLLSYGYEAVYSQSYMLKDYHDFETRFMTLTARGAETRRGDGVIYPPNNLTVSPQ